MHQFLCFYPYGIYSANNLGARPPISYLSSERFQRYGGDRVLPRGIRRRYGAVVMRLDDFNLMTA